jgi:ATP-binding cassette subfamily B protein
VDKLNLVSRENLNGIMVIRAFGTQAHETSRFEEANGDLTRINLFVNRVMVYMMPIMSLIMNGVAALVVWVGARQIADSAIQIGDMMAFIQYAMQVIMSFLMISMMFIFVPRALVSVARIKEVLNTEPSIVDAKDPKSFDESKHGLVEFKNVYFRYNNAEDDTLSNIDFTAKPGETTAIIGSTGSGKSTIVNLLLRFYDVTSGQIFVNGRDIREVSQHELRQKIGYVPQKGVLFSGSLEDNLRYGRPDATDEEVKTVANVAQADGFIHDLPDGYAYEIAQGGTNVSGGQKQRLSIARALAKNPDIFVFDDSFSALDFKTDVTLRKALKDYTGFSTVIIVAQRVSTIMHADQILVLDMGKIVGCGTHSELLKTCPEYYEIASSQLSQEELA